MRCAQEIEAAPARAALAPDWPASHLRAHLHTICIRVTSGPHGYPAGADTEEGAKVARQDLARRRRVVVRSLRDCFCHHPQAVHIRLFRNGSACALHARENLIWTAWGWWHKQCNPPDVPFSWGNRSIRPSLPRVRRNRRQRKGQRSGLLRAVQKSISSSVSHSVC